MTLVRFSVEPFLEVNSSIFYKVGNSQCICRLLTQYAIIMVQFLAGLRKIKLHAGGWALQRKRTWGGTWGSSPLHTEWWSMPCLLQLFTIHGRVRLYCNFLNIEIVLLFWNGGNALRFCSNVISIWYTYKYWCYVIETSCVYYNRHFLIAKHPIKNRVNLAFFKRNFMKFSFSWLWLH